MKRIILLGATGSIGRSTLDVVRAHPDRFCVVAASAHTNARSLARAADELTIPRVVLAGESGVEGLCRMVAETEAEIVVNAVAGAAGLRPSIAALESGKDLALANKETIVMAGELVRGLATEHECLLLPIDSEHSALFFLLDRIDRSRIRRLVLTASGGAFRDAEIAELERVTVEDALAHPTWSMGPKITIDSATMANKGLEIIEAVRLFDMPVDAIDVYIHRQSTVHALVRTVDGSMYAQMSAPDMRIPIQHALSYPEELPSIFGGVELDGLELTFEAPDPHKYPALDLARRAIALGGEYPVVYNAANETAVEAFVERRIRFPAIATIIEGCLAADWEKLLLSFEQVFDADARARRRARALIARHTNTI